MVSCRPQISAAVCIYSSGPSTWQYIASIVEIEISLSVEESSQQTKDGITKVLPLLVYLELATVNIAEGLVIAYLVTKAALNATSLSRSRYSQEMTTSKISPLHSFPGMLAILYSSPLPTTLTTQTSRKFGIGQLILRTYSLKSRCFSIYPYSSVNLPPFFHKMLP